MPEGSLLDVVHELEQRIAALEARLEPFLAKAEADVKKVVTDVEQNL